jgi:hypothetical protein
VVLDASAGEHVVRAVAAALAAEGACLESVVSSIPVRGSHQVESFAVVQLEAVRSGWSAVVVTRGRAAVDLVSLGGARRFGSGGAQPWALAEFDDVTGLAAGDLAPVPEAHLAIPADAEVLAADPRRVDRVLWSSSDLPAAAPAPDATRSAAGAPEAPVGVAEAAIVVTGTDSTAPDPAPVGALFALSLDGREPEPLDGPVIIGRRPHPRMSDSSAPQRLLAVDSPQKKVSANHVEIAPSGRTVVVTDLRSTNGTRVLVDGVRSVRLRQGDSVVAGRSAIVEIGDGNVIHISLRDRAGTGITP